MKRILFIVFFTLVVRIIQPQSLYFPPMTGSTWDKLSLKELGWDSTKIENLYQFLSTKNTKAFLVLKNGKIVIEKYFDSFTQDSLWYWASAGKTLTSFLVGIAQQEGYLSIEDSTSKYLDRWTSAPLEKEALISIRDQLSMTSGLNDNIPDHYCTLPDCLIYLADAGTRWAYHNGPYTLLDTVIQVATGQNLNQFFISKLRAKTGMTGFFIRSGYNNVFYSTPRSMARYGLLVLNKGKWDSELIMTDTNYYNQMVNTSQNINKSYGYLWWLNGKESYMLPQTQFVFHGYLCPDAPKDMIAALGKNGQQLNIVPSQNLIFVRMGNAPDTAFVPTVLNNDIWKLLNPIISPTTNFEDDTKSLKPFFHLEQNYPNPFNPSTTIKFGLPKDSKVVLEVYNIIGEKVTTLINQEMSAGYHNLNFSGNELSTGIYIYKITANEFTSTKKFVLMK